MKEQTKREPYQTDLSDDEWQRIEPYIPKPKTNRGKKREHSYREIFNAINRNPKPNAAVLDNQSVKTTETPGIRV